MFISYIFMYNSDLSSSFPKALWKPSVLRHIFFHSELGIAKDFCEDATFKAFYEAVKPKLVGRKKQFLATFRLLIDWDVYFQYLYIYIYEWIVAKWCTVIALKFRMAYDGFHEVTSVRYVDFHHCTSESRNMILCILRSVSFFLNSRILNTSHLQSHHRFETSFTHRSYPHHLSGITRMCLITASRMPVMCCTPFFVSPAFPLDAIGWGKWNSSTAKHRRLRVGSTAGGLDPRPHKSTANLFRIPAGHVSEKSHWVSQHFIQDGQCMKNACMLKTQILREMIQCDKSNELKLPPT